MTTVINMKEAPYGWMDDPKYVYIGRVGAGFDGIWGNPIVLRFEKHREQVLRLYKLWLSRRDSFYLKRMDRELVGKILVCFCKPKACHGDIIVEYVDRISDPYDWNLDSLNTIEE